MKTYAEAVQRSMSAPTVVLFTSPTCAPCKALKPILARLAGELQFPYAELNVLNEKEAAMQLGIRAVPAMVVLEDGLLQRADTGFIAEPKLRSILDAAGVTQNKLDI